MPAVYGVRWCISEKLINATSVASGVNVWTTFDIENLSVASKIALPAKVMEQIGVKRRNQRADRISDGEY
jgi:hypothetical protein